MALVQAQTFHSEKCEKNKIQDDVSKFHLR